MRKFFIRLGESLKNILLFPVKLFKGIAKKIKANRKARAEKRFNEKIELVKTYIDLANKKGIDFNIMSNYDNDLIIHLTNNTSFKVAKPIRARAEEKKEGE